MCHRVQSWHAQGWHALLVRKPALAKLQRPWYAGGTITFSSVRAEAAPGEGFYLTPGPAGFEDGTVNYLGTPAVGIGLDHISAAGVETIHTRVMCLTGWLLEALGALRRSNGAPVVCLYGPAGTDRRGATVAMNFFDPADVLIDSVRVEHRANEAGISLRSGCHWNPGVREVALGYSADEMAAAFKDKDRFTYQGFLHVIDGKTTGAARASLGLATTFTDVHRFWQFAAGFRDIPSHALGARADPPGHRRLPARPPPPGQASPFRPASACPLPPGPRQAVPGPYGRKARPDPVAVHRRRPARQPPAVPADPGTSAASPTRGTRTGFGALLLGYYDPGHQLIHAGKVGTGFSQRTLDSLHATLAGLEQDHPRSTMASCHGPVCTGSSHAWSPRWASANGRPTGNCATRGSRACGTTRTPPMSSGRHRRTTPGKDATAHADPDDR